MLRDMQWNLMLNGNLLSSGVIHWTDPYDSETPMDFSLGSGGPSALQCEISQGDEIRLEVVRVGLAATFLGIDFAISSEPVSVPELDPALQSRLDPNFPNPFNPRTTLPVHLERDGHLRLHVFDGAGRLVSRVFEGALDAGRHEFVWNGTDREGNALPSGVYMACMEQAGHRSTRRLVLLR